MDRARAFLPAAGIPLLYFSFAHACLAAAFAMLALDPAIPGPFFLHPHMAAIVHLATLGWISGSILGAFYIVAPLALRMPFRAGWSDRVAFGCYAAGVAGMVARFWAGNYHLVAWSALLVIASVLHVTIRVARGLAGATVPWPVKVHIALAFANMLAASTFGVAMGLNRRFTWFAWSPLSSAYAHLHLGAIGWATMMFVGLAYRLIPMIVPTAMPRGTSLAASAVLIQCGLIVLVVSLMRQSAWTMGGALLIVGGLISFALHIRIALRRRLPPPAALPRPDWATWQTHTALVWLLVAAVLGLVVSGLRLTSMSIALEWSYGTAGLIGFLTQVIMGMQGRLLPMQAWYGALESRGMKPPPRSAHALASPVLARWMFICWTIGVPLLIGGVARVHARITAAASCILLAGVALSAAQGVHIVMTARASGTDTAD